MESNARKLDVQLRHPDFVLTDPVRILVQTVTHLVPGNDYAQRVKYLQDLICQHHWNGYFDRDQDRGNVYGHHFGYVNRNCYFLIDHGRSQSGEDPLVLWYKRTGDAPSEVPFPPIEARFTDMCIALLCNKLCLQTYKAFSETIRSRFNQFNVRIARHLDVTVQQNIARLSEPSFVAI